MKWLYFCLIATFSLYARGGGGGGHGHGGHGGEDRYENQGNGGHGYRETGHWENHASYNGKGAWRNDHWHGNYYYHGAGWYSGGLFLVGFSFYDCPTTRISNTSIWVIHPNDVATYQSWQGYDDITIQTAYYDFDYPYRLCNGTSCIRAKRANT